MTMAMAAIETTNWDVLVELVSAVDTSIYGVLQLSEKGISVGNKRFEVLLNMHRQEFEQATTRDAQNAVILKLMDIVGRQCVPNGRFLLAGKTQAGGVRWQELSSDRAQAFVRDLLQPRRNASVGSFPVRDTLRDSLQTTTSEASASVGSFPVRDSLRDSLQTTTSEASASVGSFSVRDSLRGSLQTTTSEASFRNSLEMPPGTGVEEDQQLYVAPLPSRGPPIDPATATATDLWAAAAADNLWPPLAGDIAPPSPPTSAAFYNYSTSPVPDMSLAAAQTEHEEKKRRRRSSLLRRSVSETLVTSTKFDDKKKTVRRSFLKAGFWKSLRGKKSEEDLIDTPEPLDVLLVESRDAFQPNKTQIGNNRLCVLLDVQCDEYQKASAEAQESIVQDLVQAVTDHWGGRFLSSGPFHDSYGLLTKSQAAVALHAIFESRLMNRGISAPSTPTTEKRPSAVKQEAVQALHQVQPCLPSMTEDMRLAAVKSLQKRKQRQGLASRIRNLTALTRSTSEPAEVNATKKTTEPFARRNWGMERSLEEIQTRSTSEPVEVDATKKTTEPFARRNWGMERSLEEMQAQIPYPSQYRATPRTSDLSEGMLGDLLDGLDVSGELGMPLPGEGDEDEYT
jgi:hypothetical protein